jgi:O-antigen/teichoic acid export membrane protein
VPAYSLALALITVLGGVVNALVAPLLPVVSNLYSTQEGRSQLPALLNRSTFWCCLACQCVLLGFLVLGRPFLKLYAGSYAPAAFPILCVLLIATLLRNISYPYGIFLLGASLHHRAISNVLVEGFTNFAASLFLGYRYGAIGVAYGTLIGALASQAVFLVRTFSQTRELVPSTASYLSHGLGKSILVLSPVYLVVGIWLLSEIILQSP